MTPGSHRIRRHGFTLLEVLLAVGVLAMVYTVLAGSAMQALRAEGEANRRLRASLLADGILTEMEAELASGTAPQLGREEREEDEFTVTVEVSPLALALKQEAGTRPRSASLLSSGRRGDTSPLRQIQVKVAWVEGINDLAVTRTSFALDMEAAAPLLEEVAQAMEEAQGEVPEAAQEEAEGETP
jgi:prepilin-type N-terminal cleavage/methylation domain-containing protein